MRILPAWAPVCLLAAGCGGTNAPLKPPSYDPEGMAKAAIQQYDKNGNGTIEGTELDACPALKHSLAQFDANGDKAISADELTSRFTAYQQAGVGAMSFICTVRLNGQPLEGATVTFAPEECMKGAIKGGAGLSDRNGEVTVNGEGLSGLPAGLFRISVTKASGSGAEEVPARYNAQTTLGREIHPGARGTVPNVELNLTSP